MRAGRQALFTSHHYCHVHSIPPSQSQTTPTKERAKNLKLIFSADQTVLVRALHQMSEIANTLQSWTYSILDHITNTTSLLVSFYTQTLQSFTMTYYHSDSSDSVDLCCWAVMFEDSCWSVTSPVNTIYTVSPTLIGRTRTLCYSPWVTWFALYWLRRMSNWPIRCLDLDRGIMARWLVFHLL